MRFAAAITLIALTSLAQQLDDVIESARQAAAKYQQSLPSYLVTRTTTRYGGRRDLRAAGTVNPVPAIVNWQELDSVSAQIASEHGKEVYSDIRVNGKPAASLPKKGVWSAGEFSTLLEEILSPKHAAIFSDRRAQTRAHRPAWKYAFAIDRAHSGWDIDTVMPRSGTPERIAPAYSGAIWIDRETNQVLRVEKVAGGLPWDFPLETVTATTDYDFVEVGGVNYALPTRSETVICARNAPPCYKNETVFHNYRKFEAAATISFQ